MANKKHVAYFLNSYSLTWPGFKNSIQILAVISSNKL